ncbi:MAG: thiamine diphosphokinase [Coriobacteriia bacterium]|nr:thiamine diphosphokinase [Coriobacteriia bacterium]
MSSCLCVGAAPCEQSVLAWLLGQRGFDAIYAVDGGYASLQALDIKPSCVFGDFDSLGYVPSCASATFDTHKDFTDMDWALGQAQGEGFDEVFMVQALEGRLDHTVGNLQLLAKYARRGLRVWGFSGEQVVVCLVGGTDLDTLEFDAAAQGTFSLLGHSDCAKGVVEEGLEWELSGAEFTNESILGVSNEFKGRPARISVSQGSVWAFFPKECLTASTWGKTTAAMK